MENLREIPEESLKYLKESLKNLKELFVSGESHVVRSEKKNLTNP